MNDQEFDSKLHQLSEKPLPDCPASVQSNVMRRIRLDEHDQKQTEWGWIWELLTSPKLMASLCVLTLLFSVATTYALSNSRFTNNHPTRKQLASVALDFSAIQHHSIFTFDE